MRPIVSMILAVISLGAFTVPSLAGQKCHGHVSSVRLCDGCAVTVHWTMVRMGRGPDSKLFCVCEWRNLGGLLPSSMVQAPHLGASRLKDYRVEYRSEKLGHDTMVVKQSWVTPTNVVRSATVTYDISVVDAL